MGADNNMTVDEVRERFKLKSNETVRRWFRRYEETGIVGRGSLRGFKTAHNVLLFKQGDVEEFERVLLKNVLG